MVRSTEERQKDYITTVEAAEKAGVTTATIRTWCYIWDVGTKVGGRWRVKPKMLELLLRGELR